MILPTTLPLHEQDIILSLVHVAATGTFVGQYLYTAQIKQFRALKKSSEVRTATK